MRKLNGHDVFMALRVLKKIEIKEELVELAKAINDKANNLNQTTLGAKLILSVLANCGDEAAEKAFFEFLAGPLESTGDELASTELTKLFNMTGELIQAMDLEEWKAFFTSVVKMLRK